MTKKLLISFLLFSYSVIFGQKSDDILLCNTKAEKTDRLLMYDKDCFVWVKKGKLQDEEIIEATIGQYKTIGDTIYFSYPDSARKPNKYFCYCPDGYTKNNRMHLYFKKDVSPPDDLSILYTDLFNSKPPKNLNRFMFFIQCKAVRQKNKFVFYYADNTKEEFKIINCK